MAQNVTSAIRGTLSSPLYPNGDNIGSKYHRKFLHVYIIPVRQFSERFDVTTDAILSALPRHWSFACRAADRVASQQ